MSVTSMFQGEIVNNIYYSVGYVCIDTRPLTDYSKCEFVGNVSSLGTDITRVLAGIIVL